MSSKPDNLTIESIQERLTTSRLGRTVHLYSEVGSTNSMALELAKKNEADGTIVLAEGQNQGKGRRGRAWFSPPGLNLYFSLILHPRCSANRIPWLGLAAGVALAEATGRAAARSAHVKWPNDVLLSGKKVAGILLEQVIQGMKSEAVVLGVGINVNIQQDEFPAELVHRATSLRIESGRVVNRARFLNQVLASMEHWYDIFLKSSYDEIREKYLGLFSLLGQRIRVTRGQGVMEGKVRGLARDGGLVLECDNGEKRILHAGDISDVREL